jgi:hypothetical protein
LEEVARQAGWANESIPRLGHSSSNPTLRGVQRYAQAIGAELSLSIAGMRVVSFFNHAGGVGKSSAARDLGYVLSSLGRSSISWYYIRQGSVEWKKDREKGVNVRTEKINLPR